METACMWDVLLGRGRRCQEENGNMAVTDGMEIPGEDIITDEVWTTLPGDDMSRDISWAMLSRW